MQIGNWIAWLYWNPPREAFTVPLLDRPVMWYGISFVTGFILGYFLIVPILASFLRQSKHLASIDILNWPLLVEHLHTNNSSPLVQRCLSALNPKAREHLQKADGNQASDPFLQEQLLNSFNQVLQGCEVKREDFEQTFKGAIATATHTSHFLSDRLCWFIVAGTLIGARLGAVFFYDWPYFKEHPLEIFQVWKGGLASHGGVLGVMLTLYLYILYARQWMPNLSFLRLLDFVAIPSALAAFFIRLGNFMNQEILGTPSSLPWAVLFGQPADGSALVPRHPVQLYEGVTYLITFFFLYALWRKRGNEVGAGTYVGYLFIFIFSSRFILEFWKATQESILESGSLQMGQWLSIPFILLGILLVYKGQTACGNCATCPKRRNQAEQSSCKK